MNSAAASYGVLNPERLSKVYKKQNVEGTSKKGIIEEGQERFQGLPDSYRCFIRPDRQEGNEARRWHRDAGER